MIYGFKFEYENLADKNEKIMGLEQIPPNCLSKQFEEKTIEGKILEISYQIAGNIMKSLIISSEEVKDNVKTKVEISFGTKEPGVDWKHVNSIAGNGFLRTVFEQIQGILYRYIRISIRNIMKKGRKVTFV